MQATKSARPEIILRDAGGGETKLIGSGVLVASLDYLTAEERGALTPEQDAALDRAGMAALQAWTEVMKEAGVPYNIPGRGQV